MIYFSDLDVWFSPW